MEKYSIFQSTTPRIFDLKHELIKPLQKGMTNQDLIETVEVFQKREIWLNLMDTLRTSSKNLTDCYYKSELEFYKRYNHRAYRNEETGVRVYYQEFLKRKKANRDRNIQAPRGGVG